MKLDELLKMCYVMLCHWNWCSQPLWYANNCLMLSACCCCTVLKIAYFLKKCFHHQYLTHQNNCLWKLVKKYCVINTTVSWLMYLMAFPLEAVLAHYYLWLHLWWTSSNEMSCYVLFFRHSQNMKNARKIY